MKQPGLLRAIASARAAKEASEGYVPSNRSEVMLRHIADAIESLAVGERNTRAMVNVILANLNDLSSDEIRERIHRVRLIASTEGEEEGEEDGSA